MKKILLLLCMLMLTFVLGVLERKAVFPEKKQTELMEKEKKIRVLIKNDAYESEYHSSICVFSDTAYDIQSKTTEKHYQAGKRCTLTGKEKIFDKSEKLTITSEGGWFYLPELKRADENISYAGKMEIWKTDQGLLLINELPLETYLCGVLPCEMAPDFPMEALKAQAICARTYALQQSEQGRAEEYHADLDDSSAYQVYNNRQHSAITDQAVKETAGLVIKQNGVYADARYYSTSCGLDLRMDLSDNTVFAAFLQEDQVKSVEAEEPMFRWKTEVLLEKFAGQDGWQQIKDLEILERNQKGAVVKMKVAGEKSDRECVENIEGEYAVRAFLARANPVIVLQDGSVREDQKLLPSAFFMLRPMIEENRISGYEICGGGYGHGEGMSQNGAKHLAEKGMSCEDIIRQYFGEISIVTERADVAQ